MIRASSVTGWSEPGMSSARQLFVCGRKEGWTGFPYSELARRVRVIAAGVARETRPGQVLAVLGGSPEDLVAGFFGAMYAGAVPAVLPTPRIFERGSTYGDRLAAMLTAVGDPRIVVSRRHIDTVSKACPGPRITVLDDLLGASVEMGAPTPRAKDAPAFVQFTSGSSGQQRGVVISLAALEWQLEALKSWLVADGETDVSISWLPPHHDMGLIGNIILPITSQAETRLLPPELFVQNPLRWLSAMSEHSATVSACPPFALEHCTRALLRRETPPLDLSSLRTLVVGAERISAGTLERFAQATAPLSFDRSAILPAYGLAEATLAVAGTAPGSPITKLRLRPESVTVGNSIEVLGVGTLFDGRGEGDWLVASGRPLPGVRIELIDDEGRECADRVLGHITVCAASVASGYLGGNGFVREWPAGGPLPTGDVGFIANGELFVIGRHGDALQVRGRAVFAETIEARLKEVEGGPRRVVVLMGSLWGRDNVLIVCDGALSDAWQREALRLTRLELEGADAESRIVVVPRGTIEFTSSGKPRRRPLWTRITRGEIAIGTATIEGVGL